MNDTIFATFNGCGALKEILLAPLFENKQEFDLFSVSQVREKLRQIGQKSKRISEDEMGKRQPYGFGLGRR